MAAGRDSAEITIRKSSPEDIPSITAIYRQAVLYGLASFELAPPDEAEMGRRREAVLRGGYPYVVATAAGDFAGYAYASSYRERPAYAGTVESSVYVHEAHRGRGIARALMEEVIAQAEAGNFRQMIAVIGDSDNRASISLHEKLGFALVGTLRSVGWKHETWLDTVLMQRSLGAGDTRPR